MHLAENGRFEMKPLSKAEIKPIEEFAETSNYNYKIQGNKNTRNCKRYWKHRLSKARRRFEYELA